jgi:ABC-type antimicrobial peptide transport system permease subunit
VRGVNNPVDEKSGVAISERLAQNLFGDADPIGKTVRVAKQYDLEVRTVFQNVTDASTLQFDFVLPFELYKQQRGTGFNWGNFDHPLYVKLRDASQVDKVSKIINDLEDERARQDGGNASAGRGAFYFQPLTEVYLYGQFENGVPVGGRIEYVRIFTAVAIFIVMIACINFMNMATARAANRAKEVGVRKVVGAQRQALIAQFISESVLISFLSMMMALGVVYMLLPLFNSLVSKQIELHLLDGQLWLMGALVVVATGLLAGSYPAFFLSAFRPASVLKGNTTPGLDGSSLRRTLVVFQFALTVILIASALVINEQIEFIRSKNLGYNRESVINFSLRGDLYNRFDAFSNEVRQLPGIESVSRANANLVQVNNQNSSVIWPGKEDNTNIFFRTVVVDFGFPETMGLTLADGRYFSRDFADTNNFILNKKAVEVMGLAAPIGQKISQWGTEGIVVGVVEDFHTRSMTEAIDPVVLMCKPAWTGRAYVRFSGGQATEAIANLETLTKKYSPEYPFEYTFVDDDFEKLYKNERITSSLAIGFTTMAIVISGLGLLGLAAFTTERKRKEIGIRKTLGASVTRLVAMISTDFLKLSLMATAVGLPVAYLLMQKFLQNYAYHTKLSWQLFLLTAVIVAFFSLAIVIYQVAKAALANPVDALRNE